MGLSRRLLDSEYFESVKIGEKRQTPSEFRKNCVVREILHYDIHDESVLRFIV